MEASRKPLAKIEGRKRMRLNGLTVAWRGTPSLDDWVAYIVTGTPGWWDKEPLLVYPTQHYQNGGVQINVHGETNIPYLYMAGEVAGGVHGHNRLGANSLVDIFVFGRRSGKHSAENYRKDAPGRLSLDHVGRHGDELKALGIDTDRRSPMILPDYRFEKALTSTQYVNEIVEAEK